MSAAQALLNKFRHGDIDALLTGLTNHLNTLRPEMSADDLLPLTIAALAQTDFNDVDFKKLLLLKTLYGESVEKDAYALSSLLSAITFVLPMGDEDKKEARSTHLADSKAVDSFMKQLDNNGEAYQNKRTALQDKLLRTIDTIDSHHNEYKTLTQHFQSAGIEAVSETNTQGYSAQEISSFIALALNEENPQQISQEDIQVFHAAYHREPNQIWDVALSLVGSNNEHPTLHEVLNHQEANILYATKYPNALPWQRIEAIFKAKFGENFKLPHPVTLAGIDKNWLVSEFLVPTTTKECNVEALNKVIAAAIEPFSMTKSRAKKTQALSPKLAQALNNEGYQCRQKDATRLLNIYGPDVFNKITPILGLTDHDSTKISHLLKTHRTLDKLIKKMENENPALKGCPLDESSADYRRYSDLKQLKYLLEGKRASTNFAEDVAACQKRLIENPPTNKERFRYIRFFLFVGKLIYTNKQKKAHHLITQQSFFKPQDDVRIKGEEPADNTDVSRAVQNPKKVT